MPLEMGQLHNLLNGMSDPLHVGDLPFSVCKSIQWRLPHVYLSKSSVAHIVRKHPDMTVIDFLHLPFAITKGLLVQELKRPNCIAACYTNPDNEKQYVLAMKAAEKTCEIWVSTYHRLAHRQARSILRNGKILKRHD
jgi:hypothetical protein